AAATRGSRLSETMPHERNRGFSGSSGLRCPLPLQPIRDRYAPRTPTEYPVRCQTTDPVPVSVDGEWWRRQPAFGLRLQSSGLSQWFREDGVEKYEYRSIK